MADTYVVRLWDFYDGWIDVTGPVSKEAAQVKWNECTANGTVNAVENYRGQYYAIFPANTRMAYTPDLKE